MDSKCLNCGVQLGVGGVCCKDCAGTGDIPALAHLLNASPLTAADVKRGQEVAAVLESSPSARSTASTITTSTMASAARSITAPPTRRRKYDPQAPCPECGSPKREYIFRDSYTAAFCAEPACSLEQHLHARCLACKAVWAEAPIPTWMFRWPVWGGELKIGSIKPEGRE